MSAKLFKTERVVGRGGCRSKTGKKERTAVLDWGMLFVLIRSSLPVIYEEGALGSTATICHTKLPANCHRYPSFKIPSLSISLIVFGWIKPRGRAGLFILLRTLLSQKSQKKRHFNSFL